MVEHAETRVEESIRAWIAVLDELSFYELLGVNENASDADVKDAFHRFAESFHPDRHRHRHPSLRANVTTIFRRAVEGYRILGSPQRRAAYNFELRRHRLRLSGAPPSEIPKSLDELCRTPGGKLHGRQAERALSEGDLQAAAALIDRALIAEGPSADLEARKRAVTDALELASLSPGPAVEIPGSPRVPTATLQQRAHLPPSAPAATQAVPPPARGAASPSPIPPLPGAPAASTDPSADEGEPDPPPSFGAISGEPSEP